jgi:multiple sugar transport system ATP-binding protein
MRVKVDVVEQLGSESHLIFAVDAPRISADAVRGRAGRRGRRRRLLLADDERTQFTARVDGRVAVRAGDEVTLAVDASALHAFDCDSGLALGAGAAPQPAMAVA